MSILFLYCLNNLFLVDLGCTLSGDKCIQVFCGEPVNWDDANLACESRSSLLARIDDAETNTLVHFRSFLMCK